MAKSSLKPESSTTQETELAGQFRAAWDALTDVRNTWDDKEAMLISRLNDSQSPTFKSRVTDSRLSTIVWERAARVMAQLPSGSVRALTRADSGKNALMQLVLSRYIEPNANAQYDLLTKLRMWDLYSMVYGTMPMLIDYRIDDDYIGPDCWLVSPRNWVPQQGKVSIQDSDYNFIETWVSLSWLQSRQALKTWDKKAIDDVIKEAKKGGATKSQKDSERRSLVERDRYSNFTSETGEAAQVQLVTKYEAGEDGHWITFCPDFEGKIIRDIPNPHKNGKIPIILKHCFPLVDSIIGLGDFERGKTIQFAMDSLINLYMDGVKMSIFPPMMVNATEVAAMSSIKYQPAARWLVKGPNAIQRFDVSPGGLNTFQATYQFLTGALLNQNGTTDTATTADSSADPGMGKTPQALKMQAQRESSRDNWDRYMMEKAVEELYERFLNLLSHNQEKPINLHIFDKEIKEIAQNPGMEDVMEVFDSQKAAKITLTKKYLGNCEYKYIVDASSTMQKDQASEHANLTEILQAFTTQPGLMQALQQDGKQLHLGEAIERWLNSSGIQDADKIITDIEQPGQQMGGMPQQPMQPQGPPPPPPDPMMDGKMEMQRMQIEQQRARTMQAHHGAIKTASEGRFIDPEIAQIARQVMSQGLDVG